MIQFLIAILLGLACPGNTATTTSNNNYKSYNSTESKTKLKPIGGENGQIPPPPSPGN
jgi:hypothetical protein